MGITNPLNSPADYYNTDVGWDADIVGKLFKI